MPSPLPYAEPNCEGAEGRSKTILFNLSGHGFVDMAAYDQYLSGDLVDYTLSEEAIKTSLENSGVL